MSACCYFPLLSKFTAASADVCPKALQLSLGTNAALITQVSSVVPVGLKSRSGIKGLSQLQQMFYLCVLLAFESVPIE